MTVGQWIAQANRRLGGEAGQSRALVRQVTGLPLELQLTANPELTTGQLSALEALLNRRLSGEPLQYVLGLWPFMGLDFVVDKRALIPRYDTETLVETALKYAQTGASALDLCCGTGCVGIALAVFSKMKVLCADISPQALALVEENARLNGAQNAVSTLETDMFGSVVGAFDIIVCNPPYVKRGDIPGLERAVRDYEPLLALDGGPDGLDFYRRLADQGPGFLAPGGLMLAETGAGQGQGVAALFLAAGLRNVELIPDLNGVDRVVKGIKCIPG